MQAVQAIRGMNDILPDQVGWWQKVETAAREVLENFGYREIRTPVAEKLELFARSIGESTDIVEKEMYAFEDRNGEWLALRPEATASVVRAYIQHKLHTDPVRQKYYAIGPMFRHERPQKGRYRQFHQIDAEVFGIDTPMIDAEIMHMVHFFLNRIGVSGIMLNINTLGCHKCRTVFKGLLQEYLMSVGNDPDGFCPDCLRRRHTNPLRVFDCKVERCRTLLENAPALIDSIDDECRAHFNSVREYLTRLGTPHVINPRMVRGLDYYVRTTFEVITDRLGAQNAIGGGGRYDGLVRDLGGPDIAATGFAIGMERLILLLQQDRETPERSAKVFFAGLGDTAREKAFSMVQELRALGIETEMDYEGRSLKSQMRRADKSGARYVLILGEEEVGRGEIQLRDMREKTQKVLPLASASGMISDIISNS